MAARRHRPHALVAVAIVAGCTGTSDFVPCEEDGLIGNIFYTDGRYQRLDGTIYASAGDRPFELCERVDGFIYLEGVIPHFEDFDPFVEIGGFFDAKYNTPDPPFGSGFVGGYIKGFPNLKRITRAVYESSALLGDDPSDGGFYLEGFDQLEFVEGDFGCGGSDNLGTELRVVTGSLGCPTDRLSKLEHAGLLLYRGGVLPNLKTLGELRTSTFVSPDRFELPLLEEVGVGYEGAETAYPGDLSLGGLSAETLDLTSLTSVRGTLQIMGFRDVPLPVPEEERGDLLRQMFANVENGGRRLICNNSTTDPCPYESECEALHGEGAIECCNEAWPTCLGE